MGYKRKELLKTRDEVKKMGRMELYNLNQNSQMDMAFIMRFHTQYNSVEKIIRKHWSILQWSKENTHKETDFHIQEGPKP